MQQNKNIQYCVFKCQQALFSSNTFCSFSTKMQPLRVINPHGYHLGFCTDSAKKIMESLRSALFHAFNLLLVLSQYQSHCSRSVQAFNLKIHLGHLGKLGFLVFLICSCGIFLLTEDFSCENLNKNSLFQDFFKY